MNEVIDPEVATSARDLPADLGYGVFGKISGDRRCLFPVVGESHYQRELQELAGPRTPDGCRVRCVATLMPEPNNPYDHHAVRVEIGGLTVGYLAREEAPEFCTALASAGFLAAVTEALIQGGWERGEHDLGLYGVKLDAKLPFQFVTADTEFVLRARSGDVDDSEQLEPPSAPVLRQQKVDSQARILLPVVGICALAAVILAAGVLSVPKKPAAERVNLAVPASPPENQSPSLAQPEITGSSWTMILSPPRSVPLPAARPHLPLQLSPPLRSN